jgi:hypothetical protein
MRKRALCAKSILRVGIALVAILVGKCVFAESNSVDLAIASFPDIRVALYRSDIAVHSVNTLIAAGKDTAYPALDSRIASIRLLITNSQFDVYAILNQRLCHMIRLLFISTNTSNPLRPPQLGLSTSLPVLTMNRCDWPCLPFFITNGLPLSIHFGYNVSGITEDAGDYFKYCKSNGVFRTELFINPTFIAESNAIKQLFGSSIWKSLKWSDSEFGFSYDLDRNYIENKLMQQLTNLEIKNEMKR